MRGIELRVLLIEDSDNDAELLRLFLEQAGYTLTLRRVETADGLVRALGEGTWDIVLSDYNLPGFDALTAIRALQERQLDIPLVVVSGTIGERRAIELMRHGAQDFVLKDDLSRLPAVVERELREAEHRRRRREAEGDRERLIVELQEASRTKDEFLAMLGHELRNPLAPILTALQLLKLKGISASRELDIVERQTTHMVRLVDDLLDISRISRGKAELRLAPMELSTVVAASVEMASPLIEQRRHHLTVSVPARGLLVNADERRLAQVVSNLLTNAARYTEPGGDIAVTADRDGDEVVLRVRDSGVGIAPEALARVFEPFVQGSRSNARTEGGLGVGLAIVRGFVGLHDGTVSAHSAGANKGSEFVVRLPVHGPLSAESGLPEETPATPGAGRQVLLVDDNVDAAEMLSEALRLDGHTVHEAHDGAAALRAVESFIPEVAVLDLGLPVMDGLELGRRLRARFGDRIRLVALTGYGQQGDRARTQEAGFDHHLVKPVSLTQLTEALAATGPPPADRGGNENHH